MLIFLRLKRSEDPEGLEWTKTSMQETSKWSYVAGTPPNAEHLRVHEDRHAALRDVYRVHDAGCPRIHSHGILNEGKEGPMGTQHFAHSP